MPHSHLPPRKRPWWDQGIGVYFIGGVAVGASGLRWPSPALGTTTYGLLLYSAGMILLGVFGFAAWWRGRTRPLPVILYSIAGLTAMHGVLVWLSIGGSQTALRLAMAALGAAVLAGLIRAYAAVVDILRAGVRTLPPEYVEGVAHGLSPHQARVLTRVLSTVDTEGRCR